MGCDIHSFVAVYDSKIDKYRPIEVQSRTLAPKDDPFFDDQRSFETADVIRWRNYELFGFLTDGAVRSMGEPDCNVDGLGLFKRERMVLDGVCNSEIEDYFSTKLGYHSHGYCTLSVLKNHCKKLKKKYKKIKKSLDTNRPIDDYEYDQQYVDDLKWLIQSVELLIGNINAVVYFADWRLDVNDDEVVFCFYFDS